MAKRAIIVILLVGTLLGLIVYSKLRPVSRHVSGFIEAHEIRLGSRVGGRVAEVLADEGDPIHEGQLLVRLEPFDLEEQLRQQQAELAARQAELNRYQRGLRPEEIAQSKARFEQLQARLDKLKAGARKQEIKAARARLAVAEAQQRLASENFARIRGLVNTNAFNQEEFDSATEALESANATVTQLQEELDLILAGTRAEEIREAEAQVEEARLAWQLAEQGFRQEEIAAAEAARDAAQAAVAALETRLAELVIKSPVDGVVQAMDLRAGDLVSAGAPVVSVIDNNEYWVRCYVPQSWMKLQLEDPVQVSVDAWPQERFPARITFISQQAEFTPSNVQTPEERSKQVFRIKATLEEGLDKLRPGMSADVWFDQLGESSQGELGE